MKIIEHLLDAHTHTNTFITLVFILLVAGIVLPVLCAPVSDTKKGRLSPITRITLVSLSSMLMIALGIASLFIIPPSLNRCVDDTFETQSRTITVDDVNIVGDESISIKGQRKLPEDVQYIHFKSDSPGEIFKGSVVTYRYNPEYKVIQVTGVRDSE